MNLVRPSAGSGSCARSFTSQGRSASSGLFRPLASTLVAAGFTFAAVSTFVAPAGAQTPSATASTGVIEGRVQNSATGEYLNNARVILKGTSHVQFTDSAGRYRFAGVPSGEATLQILYTGLDEREISVAVTPGAVVQQDIALTSVARYGDTSTGDDGTVQLNEFVVSTTRHTNAATLAINEQRFAPNIKSVVSTDAFGQISENNVGEFVKYLPGVGVEYFANDIVGINVRGFGSANTEITFNGLPSATAYTESNSRTFEMRQSSTADISRVEVRKVPLPSDSANAIGGSVNLIRKTAFEQSRRRIEFTGSVNTEDEGDFTFSRTPAPGDQLMRKWRPNWNFSIIDPVTNDFGYAFSYAHSDVIAPQHWSQPGWNYGSTNATRANPWMSNPLLHDAPIRTTRDSYSLTFDWRPFETLTLSANVAYFQTERTTRDDIRYRWNIGGTPTFNDRYTTLGPTGSGQIHYDTPLWRDDENPKLDTSLSAKWKHGPWEVEGAATLSTAEHDFKDIENGFFNSSSFPLANNTILEGTTNTRLWPSGTTAHAGITGLTVNFYDQTEYAPTRIEARNAAGQSVNWGSAAAHTLRGARSRPSHTETQLFSSFLKARRDFDWAVPLKLEAGWQYTFEFRNRQRYDTNVWAFVGADGVPNTADDSASVIAADVLEAHVDPEFGYPAIDPISMVKYYDLYKAHPEYFRFQAAESYRQNAQQPMQIAEENNALYLMAETSFFTNRLNFVGGVRYEKTAAEGRGFLQSNATFQKYADGLVKRSLDTVNPDGSIKSRGTPLRLPGITANSLQEAQLNYIRKGAYGRGENDNFFPSLHGTFALTDEIVFRAAYAKTQAKVRFDRSTIPNTTITEASPTDANPSLGTINGRNPLLEPWVADNFDLRAEYYTKQGGLFAIGGFIKWIEDFQTNPTIFLADEEIAEAFGYADYVGYNYTTWVNAGTARIAGLELEARQQLDAYLPDWAHGFNVQASFGLNDLDGAASTTRVSNGDWNALNEKRGTLYVHYTRGPLRLGFGFIYQGEIFQQPETLAGEEGERILMPRRLFDMQVEYRFAKWLNAFCSVRNITGESNLSIRRSPTSAPWSQVRSDNAHGANYTLGVSGTF